MMHDHCEGCEVDRIAGLIVKEKFCCCVAEEEGKRMGEEHYNDEWRKGQREFIRSLYVDRKTLSILQAKIRELRERAETAKSIRYRLYRTERGGMYRWFDGMCEDTLDRVEKSLGEFIFYRDICLGRIKEMDKTLIETAKQTKIGNLIATRETHRGGGRVQYVCPIHKEKTGSFVWYVEQNSWHCFGCGANGDVIDLYKLIHGVNFKSAVQELASGRY